MHTVVILSDDFGATYETLPGRFRQVKDLCRTLLAPPDSHLVADGVENPRVALGGCPSGVTAEQDEL